MLSNIQNIHQIPIKVKQPLLSSYQTNKLFSSTKFNKTTLKVFTKIADLQDFIQKEKEKNQSIGFVPTMGALHDGHLSLITAAKHNCDVVVCSIFVNPTQFDDQQDFSRYPRTIEIDTQLLTANHCTALFVPLVKEIYPNNDLTITKAYDFGYLTKPMEGQYRPGHFDGMAQIVKRLLDIVQPDKLFMGQKDYQQFTIVQRLINITQLPVDLIRCPIIRENDGLAMSSRNRLLPPKARQEASILYKTLQTAKAHFAQKKPVNWIKSKAYEQLSSIEGLDIDYFEIVAAGSLTTLANDDFQTKAIACLAIKIGGIRLIDNMFLN